jgi:DNA-directed RNA polymerase specialized sigma24 family protein
MTARECAVPAALTDRSESPFDNVAHREVQRRVDEELRKVPEPYRTTLVLRDLEAMSYEEIAEVLEISLGTVKSRLTRGREALRQRLASYVREAGTLAARRCRMPSRLSAYPFPVFQQRFKLYPSGSFQPFS